MKRKILFTCFILVCLLFIGVGNSFILADTTDYGSWWNGATSWYKDGSSNVGVDENVLSGISNIVEVIGTAVIAIVTVVLGMKYMLGSAQGKSEVKENLIGLIVACTFFFGWASIRDLLIIGNATGDNGLTGATHLVFFGDGNLESALSQIFSFILIVAKFIAVAVIAYNGMKYIFAGAEAKAQLKQKTPIMIVGIILIFCTITFIEFIVSAVNSAI